MYPVANINPQGLQVQYSLNSSMCDAHSLSQGVMPLPNPFYEDPVLKVCEMWENGTVAVFLEHDWQQPSVTAVGKFVDKYILKAGEFSTQEPERKAKYLEHGWKQLLWGPLEVLGDLTIWTVDDIFKMFKIGEEAPSPLFNGKPYSNYCLTKFFDKYISKNEFYNKPPVSGPAKFLAKYISKNEFAAQEPAQSDHECILIPDLCKEHFGFSTQPPTPSEPSRLDILMICHWHDQGSKFCKEFNTMLYEKYSLEVFDDRQMSYKWDRRCTSKEVHPYLKKYFC